MKTKITNQSVKTTTISISQEDFFDMLKKARPAFKDIDKKENMTFRVLYDRKIKTYTMEIEFSEKTELVDETIGVPRI